jgi:hypothetical protein
MAKYDVVAAAVDSISINLIISTIEPIFAKTAGETMTPKLCAQLQSRQDFPPTLPEPLIEETPL